MKSNIFALVFGEFETFRRVNPSVKTVSQEPVLPAPLTQGSLRRSCARGFIDTLSGRPKGRPRFCMGVLQQQPQLSLSQPQLQPQFPPSIMPLLPQPQNRSSKMIIHQMPPQLLLHIRIPPL